MTLDLWLQTLKVACGTQKTSKENLIFQSDMGSQYTSSTFNKALKQFGIKHSYRPARSSIVLMSTKLLNLFVRP